MIISTFGIWVCSVINRAAHSIHWLVTIFASFCGDLNGAGRGDAPLSCVVHNAAVTGEAKSLFVVMCWGKTSGQRVAVCVYLVGGLVAIKFMFPYIGNVIIPIDVHILQRGGPTTNQILFLCSFWGDPQLPCVFFWKHSRCMAKEPTMINVWTCFERAETVDRKGWKRYDLSCSWLFLFILTYLSD